MTEAAPAKPVPCTPAEHARRRRAYDEGVLQDMNLAEIARHLRLNPSTFRKWVDLNIEHKNHTISKPVTVITTRPCMTCSAPMKSTGAHHRLCNYCRARAADASPYAPNPGGDTGRQARRA
jgi:tRNA(Ile2) C34 agmatinyltransferase TiaS